MQVTITVSDRAARNIQLKAEANGKPVEDFVEDFVEESFANGSGEPGKRMNNLLAFAGRFESGKTDTSERMSELLDEAELDPSEGFSIK